MEIKVTNILRDENGNDLVEGDHAIRLRDIITRAMLANVKGDENASLSDKMKRWDIHKAVCSVSEYATLKAEDIVLIKERVNACFGVLIVGQVVDYLESLK